MVNTSHLVSVVMPVFNGEKYIGEAIKSVLDQTYRHIEVIVVDDGSTDRSAEEVRRFAPLVGYYPRPHGGIGAALNYGLSLAQGSYFAFLDADDLWIKNKLTVQLSAFGNDPDVDMIFGQVRQFYSPDLDDLQRRKVRIFDQDVAGIFKGSMLIKRASFLKVGNFEARWKIGDFIDWYARALEKGLKSIISDEVILLRRIHADNTGLRERDSRNEFARILKASLDRRRRE